MGIPGSLRVESRQAICSFRFLFSVAILLGWLMLNGAEGVKTYDHAQFAGVTQLLRLAMGGHSATSPVILAISTLPYALRYLTETECGFRQQAVLRVGVLPYGLGKVFATFLSAFSMGFLAVWAFLGTLSLLGIPHTVRYEEVKGTYAIWAVTLGPGWYYLARAALTGLVCGQAALFFSDSHGLAPQCLCGVFVPPYWVLHGRIHPQFADPGGVASHLEPGQPQAAVFRTAGCGYPLQLSVDGGGAAGTGRLLQPGISASAQEGAQVMQAFRILKLNFLRWRHDPKCLAAMLYVILYSYDLLHGLRDYADSLGSPIAPWVLPFLPCLGAGFLPMMLGFVLLVSDAPFATRQQRFVMQRTGKRVWIFGQLLSVFAVSVLFGLLLWVLSWVWLLPDLQWSGDWGGVLRTAAINGIPTSFHVYMDFPYTLVKNTQPLAVTAWSLGAMIGVCFLLGTILAFCNLWLGKGWGAVIVAVLSAMSLILDYSAQNPGPIRKILWISPLNWMNYSLMGHREQLLPSHAYGILCPLLLGLIISSLMVLTIGKCNVEGTKE